MLANLLALLPLLAVSVNAVCNGAAKVITNCQNSNQVALTFDDGPYLYEDDISSRFLAAGAKATFFLNGNNWDCIYNHVDTIRNLHSAGHTVASHTWSHPDLTTLNYAQIDAELEKVELAFIRILGLKPLYFRPPYGNYNDLVLQVLKDRGYQKVFIWSDDTEDADGQSVSFGENVLTTASNQAGPHIVLMHSTEPHTHDQLVPFALNAFKNKGYGIVSVDTCLGSDGEWPYVYIGAPGTPDSTWTC